MAGTDAAHDRRKLRVDFLILLLGLPILGLAIFCGISIHMHDVAGWYPTAIYEGLVVVITMFLMIINLLSGRCTANHGSVIGTHLVLVCAWIWQIMIWKDPSKFDRRGVFPQVVVEIKTDLAIAEVCCLVYSIIIALRYGEYRIPKFTPRWLSHRGGHDSEQLLTEEPGVYSDQNGAYQVREYPNLANQYTPRREYGTVNVVGASKEPALQTGNTNGSANDKSSKVGFGGHVMRGSYGA